MIQQKQFVGGLLALGISIALQANVSATTDTPSSSLLMSEAEVATHTATMATLTGQAREDYRNAQYERLRKRAQQQGFDLPADPPWAGAAAATAPVRATSPAGGDEAAAEAAARHAALREKLQARREALQKDSEGNLRRLQEAAKAQQKQVNAELEVLGKENGGRAAAAKLPPAPPQATPPAAPQPPAVTPLPSAPAAVVAETPASQAPAVVAAPIPPTPPTPPTAPARGPVATEMTPRFAPVEQTAAPMPPPPPAAAPAAPPAPAQMDATAAGQPPAADADAMTAYRENMRTRFDEYMAERRTLMEEKARQQREQHEAAMQQNRALRANRPAYPPYPYPAAPPSYGPRYPAAYPGYRTPYWQQ